MAPFDYARLLFATVAGYIAFAEVPDHWTLAGAAIVIGSTLYIAHRETRHGGSGRPPRGACPMPDIPPRTTAGQPE